MNLIRAKQTENERRHARRERCALQRRRSDPTWGETAFHEAGHAAADTHYEHHVLRVRCNPDAGDRLAGQCQFLTGGAVPFQLAVSALAGSIAEYLGGFTTRIEYDRGDMAKALRQVAGNRIPAAESAAIRLLVNHWRAVRAIATELVQHGELSGTDVRSLMEKHSHWRAA